MSGLSTNECERYLWAGSSGWSILNEQPSLERTPFTCTLASKEPANPPLGDEPKTPTPVYDSPRIPVPTGENPQTPLPLTSSAVAKTPVPHAPSATACSPAPFSA